MAVDTLARKGWQVAAVVRIVAERARQLKEIRQSDEPHFQVRGKLYVSGQQRVVITRMLRGGFQNLTRARQQVEKPLDASGDALYLPHVTRAQVIHALAYVFRRDAFVAQGFGHDLQIRHAGDMHLRELAGCSEHAFEHRDRVVLERARAL